MQAGCKETLPGVGASGQLLPPRTPARQRGAGSAPCHARHLLGLNSSARLCAASGITTHAMRYLGAQVQTRHRARERISHTLSRSAASPNTGRARAACSTRRAAPTACSGGQLPSAGRCIYAPSPAFLTSCTRPGCSCTCSQERPAAAATPAPLWQPGSAIAAVGACRQRASRPASWLAARRPISAVTLPQRACQALLV